MKGDVQMKKAMLFLLAVIMCFCCFSGTERMASAAYAEENGEKHPIDAELEKRLDADFSTSGMVEAFVQTSKEWDKLLNENYNALMKKLSKEEQDKLKASQREWIKYRDLEFAFNKKYWEKFSGTMYIPLPYSFQCDFVRGRALQLGSYLKDLEDM
jgi:uncharacterized protein YecT (DUF1311 family)